MIIFKHEKSAIFVKILIFRMVGRGIYRRINKSTHNKYVLYRYGLINFFHFICSPFDSIEDK